MRIAFLSYRHCVKIAVAAEADNLIAAVLSAWRRREDTIIGIFF